MLASEVPTVLVVDDDRVTRKVLELRLQSAGFGVVAAENGTDALKFLEEREYATVILDLMLPDVSGPAIIAHLRETNPSILEKIIVLSALDETARKRLDVEGVCAVMRKPVDHKTLMDLVRFCAQSDPGGG